MDEELIKFVEGKLMIDMNGTVEDDWRQLVKQFSQIGFDLDKAVMYWFRPYGPYEPFVEYEQQNIKGPHKNGGWELQYPHLSRTTSGVNSVKNPTLEGKHSVSYLELKKEFERAPKFTLDF